MCSGGTKELFQQWGVVRVVNCSYRTHQNRAGAGLACRAMLQHAMAHRGLCNEDAPLCECSGNIRVTKTCDCPLQSRHQRFAGVMRIGVSIISPM